MLNREGDWKPELPPGSEGATGQPEELISVGLSRFAALVAELERDRARSGKAPEAGSARTLRRTDPELPSKREQLGADGSSPRLGSQPTPDVDPFDRLVEHLLAQRSAWQLADSPSESRGPSDPGLMIAPWRSQSLGEAGQVLWAEGPESTLARGDSTDLANDGAAPVVPVASGSNRPSPETALFHHSAAGPSASETNDASPIEADSALEEPFEVMHPSQISNGRQALPIDFEPRGASSREVPFETPGATSALTGIHPRSAGPLSALAAEPHLRAAVAPPWEHVPTGQRRAGPSGPWPWGRDPVTDSPDRWEELESGRPLAPPTGALEPNDAGPRSRAGEPRWGAWSESIVAGQAGGAAPTADGEAPTKLKELGELVRLLVERPVVAVVAPG